tara:strand:- start:463 stop:753 length:291 start_codon:yes stop_codon:yes gene_type:complete
MAATKSDALHSLKPGAEWSLAGDTLTWLDSEQTAPTDSEITAEMTRLDTVYANEKYKRDRAAEYPSIADQLDDLYHNGIDGWKATIKTTKDKYPKP